MSASARCQSCGMPLKADPKHGGTNADGSLSVEFCSYCYESGTFVNPAMSLEEMRTLVVDKLHEKGWPRFVGRLLATDLQRLNRWRGAAH